MSTPANHFKIGLFTLGGLAILILGIFAFGARGYFQRTSLYETYIAGDVTGLTVGSAVDLRGVRVGKVTRIGFSWGEYQQTDPNYIVVEFELREDVVPPPAPGETRDEMVQAAVKRGLRARLKAQGITGTSILSLESLNPDDNPPAEVPWKPKYIYIPSVPSQFGELLTSAEKSLHNLEHLDFAGINLLLQNDLKSAGKVLDKAGQIDFGALSTNANGLLTELRGSNVKLKSLIEDTDDTVKKMKLEKLSRDVDALVGQLQGTVASLQPGLANIDFDALNQTLTNARRTINDMDQVLLELKEYPPGFLFGKPPLPVKEVQSPVKP
jgi:ABC-type transporter Mla subunit MlaD